MKRLALMVLFVVGLSLSQFPQATAGGGKIMGVVTETGTGQPLPGVTVKLYSVRAGGYLSPSPVTDADGKWKAMHIRGGMWNLDFEKVGYETKKLSYNLDPTPGRRSDPVEINLKKIEGPVLDEKIVAELNKAKDLLSANNIQEALKAFIEVKDKYKELEGIAIVNLYIGNCYSSLEEYAKAIEYFLLALEKYPKNMDLILSIGNAYNNMKQVDKAMEWFNKIPFEEIQNVDTLYNIGVNLYNSAKYADAVKYFKRAIEINPEYAVGFYQLGMTYTALSMNTEAVAALKKFIELDPNSPDVETAKAIVDAFSK